MSTKGKSTRPTGGPSNPNLAVDSPRKILLFFNSLTYERIRTDVTAHVSFAGRSLYVGNNIGTCLLDSGTRFEPVVGSPSCPPLLPCPRRAGPTGYVHVLVLSRVPSTRLVHFLPRAPDPRATHWGPAATATVATAASTFLARAIINPAEQTRR